MPRRVLQMTRMVRLRCIVCSLALACLVAQVSGMTKLYARACEADCPGDDDHGGCPSDCADCVCCALAPSVATPAAPDIAPPSSIALGPPHPAGAVPAAEPRGIEHVPKLARE